MYLTFVISMRRLAVCVVCCLAGMACAPVNALGVRATSSHRARSAVAQPGLRGVGSSGLYGLNGFPEAPMLANIESWPSIEGLAGHQAPTTVSVGFAASREEVTNTAPPTVICGQTVYDEPVGIGTRYYTKPGRYEFPEVLQVATQTVVLEFVRSCGVGVDLAFSPPHLLKIDAEARARDGKLVAVAISVSRAAVSAHRAGTVRIIVKRPRAHRTIVAIRVVRPA